MGVEINSSAGKEKITEIIVEMDKTFDLVVIIEKMDESLILMKELLCWNFEDIVFLVKNARKKSMKVKMTAAMRKNVLEFNQADDMLYEHFLNKHEEAVNRYGASKMEEQVLILRKLRDEMLSRCNIDMDASFKLKVDNKFFNRVNAYNTTSYKDRECQLLMTQELTLVSNIRKKQIQRIEREREKIQS